jgi:gamma-butyrobetaine dioxygenase
VTTNLADSDLGLEPHTDNPYRTPVPGLQLLHALQTAGSGGGSLLVDGFMAAARLQAEDPTAFNLLAQYPVTFTWQDGHTFLSATVPVLGLDAHGDCCAIRFNHRSFRVANVPAPFAGQWRSAYCKFGRLIEEASLQFRFHFQPGDIVMMDNERILHGREAYDSRAHERWLQGAYADKDAVRSTLKHLLYRSVRSTVDEINSLFASDAAHLTYGEDLSLADHMLQTADLLAAKNESDALVVAALLHDIGWMLEAEEGHEHSGADYLLQRLGPDVSEPVRLHVDAKRWLVTTRPEYFERLSEESRRTLTIQGGPMTAAECEAFENQTHFRSALKLRLADDQGKDRRITPHTVADYLPLVRRLAFLLVNGYAPDSTTPH